MAAVRVSWYVRVRTGVGGKNMWALGGPPPRWAMSMSSGEVAKGARWRGRGGDRGEVAIVAWR